MVVLCIFDSKYWIYSFLFIASSNTSPRFLSLPPREKEIIHFPQATCSENVFGLPAERWEGKETTKLKKWPKLNLRVYWPDVLLNPTIFVPSTFLISVLLCHSFDSIMLKCKGSLTKLTTVTKFYCVQEWLHERKNRTLTYFVTISNTLYQIKLFIVTFFCHPRKFHASPLLIK